MKVCFSLLAGVKGGAAEGCILLLYDQSLRANVGLSREGSVLVCFFLFFFFLS